MANGKSVVDLTGGSDDEQRREFTNQPSSLHRSSIKASTSDPSSAVVDLTEEDDAPVELASWPKATQPLPKTETPSKTPELHFLAKPYSSSSVQSMLRRANRQPQSPKKFLNHTPTPGTETMPRSKSPSTSKPHQTFSQPSKLHQAFAEDTSIAVQEVQEGMSGMKEGIDTNDERKSSVQREKDRSPHSPTSRNGFIQDDAMQDTLVGETAVPLDLREFQEVLKKSLRELHQDHRRFVSSRLMHARQPCQSEMIPSQFIQQSSPFKGMSSVKSHIRATGKPVRGHGRLEQAKSVKAHNEKIDVPLLSYTAEKVVIPPYTNYIATRRNVLIGDDKRRTFLPYHGDDAWVDTEYADLESKIGRNRLLYHKLNHLEEQARLYGPYAERFIQQVGCSMSNVLYYLLDETSPPVPEELPTELAIIWRNRQRHITDDYYDDSDDAESITPRKNVKAQSKQPKEQWQIAFINISELPKGRALAAAGLACAVFLSVAGFSLWHIAKKYALTLETNQGDSKSNNASHDAMHDPSSSQENSEKGSKLSTYAELGCLICFAHECPGHGEFEDDDYKNNVRVRINAEPLSSNQSMPTPKNEPARFDTSTISNALGQDEDGNVAGQPLIPIRGFDHAFRDDEICSESCFWLKSNRLVDASDFSQQEMEDMFLSLPAYYNDRRGACMLALFVNKPCVQIYLKMLKIPPEQVPQSVKSKNQDRTISHRPPGKPHSSEWWYQNSRAWKHHERRPFRPCNHSGPCTSMTNCDCIENDVTCEKSCMCADTCSRRYQGCTCAAKNRACWENEKCECFRLHRECDPDLCRSCGAHEALDPTNRYREDILAGRCTNVYIQRGVPCRTLLGHSKLLASGNLSGWGLYAGQTLKKGDYIGEYVGEVVSTDEGERRGVIYDKRNMSYLFDLNSEQTLDSTRVGNKLRYINHQGEPYANCKAKVLLCGTVQRIGMFALQAVAVGDEILFDYGESFTQRFELIKLDENARPRLEKGKNSNSSKKKLVNVKATSKKTGKPPGRPRKYPIVETEPPKYPKAQLKLTLAPATKPATRNKTSEIHMLDEVSGDTEEEEERPRPSRKRKQNAMYTGLDGAADEEMEDTVPDDESSESYHESDEGEDDEEGEEDEAQNIRLPSKDLRSNEVTVPKRKPAGTVAIKTISNVAAFYQRDESEDDEERKEDEAEEIHLPPKNSRSNHVAIPKIMLTKKTAVKTKPSGTTLLQRGIRDTAGVSFRKTSYRDSLSTKQVRGAGERAKRTLPGRPQQEMKSPAAAFQPAVEEGKQKQMARKTSGR